MVSTAEHALADREPTKLIRYLECHPVASHGAKQRVAQTRGLLALA